jgi:hypothetical protein
MMGPDEQPTDQKALEELRRATAEFSDAIRSSAPSPVSP